MRKDIENELLKYGMEVNLLNKSELARRMNCSRQTINTKLKKLLKPKEFIQLNQMPFGAWGDVFNDNILASAILDRLLDQAYVVKIVGESYRTKYLAVNKKSAG